MKRLTGRWRSGPRLSVVVPVYNVERYLDECLRSITEQSFGDFEVVMVDDGSTDTSAEIAAAWEAKDSRFHLVRQANHGLGHARNTGVKYVRGKYLAFLDSDDITPPDAYSQMVECLEETGSDFATGNVHRFNSSGFWQAPMYRGMFGRAKLRTHVTQSTELLKDHLAHNKVWRTSFWLDHGLEFPVGVLYEDVPTTIPAHYRARAVDVLPTVAVFWREREGEDRSITQSRATDARHVWDRVNGCISNSRFFLEQGAERLRATYDTLVLNRDLRFFVDLYDIMNDQYRDEVRRAVESFLEIATPGTVNKVTSQNRIKYALLTRGATADLAAFVKLCTDGVVADEPVVVAGRRAVIDLPARHDSRLALPEETFDVARDLKLVSTVTDIRVEDDELLIEGWAYIDRLSGGHGAAEIEVWLSGDGPDVDARVTRRTDPLIRAYARPKMAECEASAFTAAVSLSALRASAGREGITWSVMVAVTHGPVRRASTLTQSLTGRAGRPLTAQVDRDWWLRVAWEADGLACRLRPEHAVLTSMSLLDSEVKLSLAKASYATAPVLELRSSPAGRVTHVPTVEVSEQPGLVEARIRIEDIVDTTASRDSDPDADKAVTVGVYVRPTAGGPAQRVLVGEDVVGVSRRSGGRELAARRTRYATLDIVEGPVPPTLDSVTWIDEGCVNLVVSAPSDASELVLAAVGTTDEVIVPAINASGQLTVQVDLAKTESTASPSGRAVAWDLKVRTPAGDWDVAVGDGVVATFPSISQHGDVEYRIDERPWRAVRVAATPRVGTPQGPLPPRVRGRRVWREEEAAVVAAPSPAVAAPSPAAAVPSPAVEAAGTAPGKRAPRMLLRRARVPAARLLGRVARKLEGMGAKRLAELCLLVAIRLFPWHAHCLYDLGRLRQARRDWAGAQHAYQRALRFRKGMYGRGKLGGDTASCWEKLGRVRESLEDWRGAEEAYAMAAKLKPKRATVHSRRGLAYERLQQWHKAVQCYRRALRLKGSNDAKRGLARALVQCGRSLDAIDILSEALSRGRDAATLKLYAEVAHGVGDWEAAADAWRELIDRDESDLGLRYQLAMTLEQVASVPFPIGPLGQFYALSTPTELKQRTEAAFQEAVQSLTYIRQHDPDRARDRFRLGRILERHGELDAAAEVYQDAVETLMRVDSWWRLQAEHAWRFRLAYVSPRPEGAAVDPLLLRAIEPGEQIVNLDSAVGFFEATVNEQGVRITGFIAPRLRGRSVEVRIDGVTVATVSTDGRAWRPTFVYDLTDEVVVTLPSRTKISVMVDGHALASLGGAGSVWLKVPDGDGTIWSRLAGGAKLTKRGGWALSGSELAARLESYLEIYCQAKESLETRVGRKLFLCYGTLLGCYRQGGFIPGDDDFDSSYVSMAPTPEEFKREAMDIALELLRSGLDVHFSFNGRMFKVARGDAWIDVTPMWFYRSRAWAFDSHDIAPSVIEPVQPWRFLDRDVYIPADPVAFLEENYGPAWATPQPDFQYYRSKADDRILQRMWASPSDVAEFARRAEEVTATVPGAGRFTGVDVRPFPRAVPAD